MLAGVLPFALALGYALLGLFQLRAGAIAFALYAALILSFLGGMRWGRAVVTAETAARLIESVVPTLLAFTAVMLVSVNLQLALATSALGFAIWLLRDARDTRWPQWLRRWRVIISLIVLLLHVGMLVLLRTRLPGY